MFLFKNVNLQNVLLCFLFVNILIVRIHCQFIDEDEDDSNEDETEEEKAERKSITEDSYSSVVSAGLKQGKVFGMI